MYVRNFILNVISRDLENMWLHFTSKSSLGTSKLYVLNSLLNFDKLDPESNTRPLGDVISGATEPSVKSKPKLREFPRVLSTMTEVLAVASGSMRKFSLKAVRDLCRTGVFSWANARSESASAVDWPTPEMKINSPPVASVIWFRDGSAADEMATAWMVALHAETCTRKYHTCAIVKHTDT